MWRSPSSSGLSEEAVVFPGSNGGVDQNLETWAPILVLPLSAECRKPQFPHL